MEVKHRLQLYIQSQTAEATPPLGTVLGNLGVNTVNFCKEFNSYTADLPSYFTLAVYIEIFNNRSYRFSLGKLPLGPLLQILSTESSTPKGKKNGPYRSMSIHQAIQLARWQYPTLDLPRSFPLLLGSLKSARILII